MKILKNRKIIYVVVVALILGVVSITYVNSKGYFKTYSSNQPIVDKSKLMDSKSFNSHIKDFKTESEVAKNIKFKAKEPTYIYKNMKKSTVEGRNESSNSANIDVIISYYTSDDNKQIRIQESQDTGKPDDLITNCKKISIDGIDAWILNDKSGDNFTQVMIWKDGMYYNVSGDISADELVKITQSLK